MRTTPLSLPGVVLVEPEVHGDDRGYFLETYQARRYAEAGIADRFVQDNQSLSRRGVLRGLHYQVERPQGKLVWVVSGEVLDVAVDIVLGSPTFGHHVAVSLSDRSRRQLYVPPGYAHGFCVVSEIAVFAYKCTDYYLPRLERGVRWDDPDLGIAWPVMAPIVNERDAGWPTLGAVHRADLPVVR